MGAPLSLPHALQHTRPRYRNWTVPIVVNGESNSHSVDALFHLLSDLLFQQSISASAIFFEAFWIKEKYRHLLRPCQPLLPPQLLPRRVEVTPRLFTTPLSAQGRAPDLFDT